MAIREIDRGLLTWSESQVLRELETGPGGLNSARVLSLQEQWGPNRLPDPRNRPLLSLLVGQFMGPLALLLGAAVGLSLYLGEWEDAVAMAAILLVNGGIGFYQEWKGEAAIRALRSFAVPRSRVRRDGRVQDISSHDLVPGDIVLLEAGCQVPADGRLIESEALRTEEASLTGESVPVLKEAASLPHNSFPVAEQSNMVFLGTHVTQGRGVAVVTATGTDTELGKVASLLHTVERGKSPLQKRLSRLGRDLALVALVLVSVVVGMGWLAGEPLRQLIVLGLSLAVAAVPEGLVVVATIALALGARRMLGHHALVRRLHAVETMGAVTVVCSDKTGTLTQNRMELREAVFLKGGKPDPGPGGSDAMALIATLCADVHGETGSFLGDPTEVALVEAADGWGFEHAHWVRQMPRVGEIPFSSPRRRMTSVHSVQGTKAFGEVSYVALSKGAFDAVLPLCHTVWDESTGAGLMAQKEWEGIHQRLTGDGMRVLALSFRPLTSLEDKSQWETRHHFVGLVALWDPPRVGAKESVMRCRAAGIRPVMITGDSTGTALAIGQQLGFGDRVLAGSSLQSLSDTALRATLNETSIFARVSPGDKLRLVQSLQRMGEVVAMTGDGVNDGPALKSADVGVAMGKCGTDVAREAADVVLLDDNFTTLVESVAEGRVVYDNIRKFIRYILAGNLGELGVMLSAPLVGLPLPLLPLQILWINLVSDGPPALALSAERGDSNVMSRPPIRPGESVFARGLGWDVLWVGLVLTGLGLGLGWAWSVGGKELAEMRTGVFTVLALSQMVNVVALRKEVGLGVVRIWSNLPLLGSIVLVFFLQVVAVYHPIGNRLLGTVPLSHWDFASCLALSLVPGVLIEVKKKLFGPSFK